MLPRPWWGTGEDFRPYLDRFFESPFRELERHIHRWQVNAPVEVLEREGEVVIRAELAGVEPEDLDVRITDDAVTIRGERRTQVDEERDGSHYSERSYGSFARTVAFPAPVDSTAAQASFRHGLLEIRAPRRDPQDGRDGRRLNIQVH